METQLVELVKKKKLIAIVRGVAGNACVNLAKALYAGGIELIEVTFNQQEPDRFSVTTDAIRAIAEAMQGKMHVGAGTVTSVELVERAARAGAEFIVSPDTNPEVIRRTKELHMVSMPGALTPSEALTAYRAGADFVKVFPAGDLGPGYIKAMRGPLNQIPLLAVGGVNEKNIAAFLKAGCCGAGCGGNLVNKEWIANGEFEKITALAMEFVANANA